MVNIRIYDIWLIYHNNIWLMEYFKNSKKYHLLVSIKLIYTYLTTINVMPAVFIECLIQRVPPKRCVRYDTYIYTIVIGVMNQLS